jgi:FtsP/CotA-like multicopper oxidase with cupredoxin domain
MSGAFIIEDEYNDALNKYYRAVPNWTRTQPLLLVNQIGGTPNLERPPNGRTDKGLHFSVNGRLQPKMHMYPGEVQMWRILNSSPRSAMYVPYLPEGFTWRQLAQDGVQLAPENYEKSQNRPLRIASGNRVDLLVRAPDKPHATLSPAIVQPNVAGAEINLVPDARAIRYPSTLPPPVPLIWVEVSGKGPAIAFIPKEHLALLPVYLANITNQEVAGHTRTVTFNTGGPGSGKQQTIDWFQFSDIDQSTWIEIDKLNTVEEWTIVNTTTFQPIDHPFHIHINPFQVTEVFDPNRVVKTANGPAYRYVFDSSVKLDPAQCYLNPAKPETWKPCGPVKQPANLVWWDVFAIPSGRSLTVGGTAYTNGGYFKMRGRFVDFAGAFVLHRHILAHEDRRMMTIVAVGVPPGGLSNLHHH